jgi:hypothetical protein
LAKTVEALQSVTNPRSRWVKYGSPGVLYGGVGIAFRSVAT